MTDDAKAKKPGGSGGGAPWLEWIQRWERTIGEPIESFVRSDAYFDLMTQFKRARSQVTRTFESVCEEWLHLFNRPAATDVRKVREQLSRLERQVNRIAKDLEDREEAARDAEAAQTAAAARPEPKAARPSQSEPAQSKQAQSKGAQSKGTESKSSQAKPGTPKPAGTEAPQPKSTGPQGP